MLAMVTGGSGFLGRYVIKELMKHPEVNAIISISRSVPESHIFFGDSQRWIHCEDSVDIENEAAVASTLYSYKPDVIFHLAANPVVKENALRPCDISRTNIMGTHHLLAHCKEGTRFAFASSATVYGDQYGEEYGTKPLPTSVYGATKLASEHLIRAYASLGKISPIIYRLVANVGHGAKHGVVPDLVRKLRSNSEELEIIGNLPGSVKPYTHAEDTAKFMVDITLNPAYRGVVNVSSDLMLSADNIADLIMETVGIRKIKKWLGSDSVWAGDNKEVKVNNSLAKQWGFSPKYPMSQNAVVQAVKEIMGVS